MMHTLRNDPTPFLRHFLGWIREPGDAPWSGFSGLRRPKV